LCTSLRTRGREINNVVHIPQDPREEEYPRCAHPSGPTGGGRPLLCTHPSGPTGGRGTLLCTSLRTHHGREESTLRNIPTTMGERETLCATCLPTMGERGTLCATGLPFSQKGNTRIYTKEAITRDIPPYTHQGGYTPGCTPPYTHQGGYNPGLTLIHTREAITRD